MLSAARATCSCKPTLVFPQTGLPVGFYLRKKRLDTLVGALCCVGRGFGRAGRAALGRVGRRFGSAWRARLGWAWDLAVLGAWAGLGVGFGSGGCAGLGWVRIWLSEYGLHCTCLLHVFVMSLYLSSCVSQMVSWGLSKTKPGIREWNVVLSNSMFEKCDVKRTKWKRKERNGSSGNQRSFKRRAWTTVQFSNY